VESSGSAELEKLKKLYEEWARGDYSEADIFASDMKMETFGMGDTKRSESYEGFVSEMRDWLRAWERPIKIEPEEFIQSGDRILVMIRWSGRGKGSGAQIDAEGAHLWTFRDGLVVDYGVYRDRDEARVALQGE
jgi:ketosteroid isomerase-like protein